MKKIIRLTAVIIVLIMMSAMLTSCTSDEMSFLKAMEKFAAVTSYQSTSELSTNITAEFPSYMADSRDWPNPKSILNSLKNFKLTTNIAVNMDKNKMLSKLEMGVSSEDFMFNTSGYIKSDDNGIVETFKIPTTLRWMLPEENMNAEYITIDTKELNSYLTELTSGVVAGGAHIGMASPMPFSITPKNLVAESKKISEAYYKFQTDYAKKMLTSPEVITKAGYTYKLKFTDQTLKLFAKAVADTYLQDKEARDSVENFINEVIAFYDNAYPDMITTDIKAQIFGTLGGFSAVASEYQEQVDNFFKLMESIPILGSNGMEIKYTVDGRGFLSKTEGYIDLLLDMNAISEAMGGYAEDEPYSFNILLNFKEEYKNINSKIIVDFPKLTDENNLSYVSLLKSIVEKNQYDSDYYPDEHSYRYRQPELNLPAPDGSISIVHYGEIVDFGDTKPEIINNTLYVPLDKMSSYFYFDYRWDYDANCAVINRDGVDLEVYIGDSMLYCDDYAIILSNDTVDFNGQVYVPFRSFMKAFFGYYNVEWDKDKNAAIVGYYDY